MSDTDWRSISITKISYDLKDLRNKLLPVLKQSIISSNKLLKLERLAMEMTRATQKAFEKILPFADHEKEFLSKIQEKGIISPGLICSEVVICNRISNHPALTWKTLLATRKK